MYNDMHAVRIIINSLYIYMYKVYVYNYTYT